MESKEVTITTGVDDVKEVTLFKEVWEIRNFDLILQDDELLSNQTILVETSQIPNTSCKWKIGLVKEIFQQYRHRIRLYCELTEINGGIGPQIHVKLYTECKKAQGGWTYFGEDVRKLIQREKLRSMSVDIGVISGEYVHSNGSGFFNIELTMLRQAITNILCQNGGHPDAQKKLSIGSQNTLINNLGKLLIDEDTSDVKIIASDGVELYGHKLILKMQNPVFASMLQSDFREGNTGVVNVRDINGQTMGIILRYLYTGELLPEWSDAETIVDFVYAAGKYQLTEVLNMLDETLGTCCVAKYSSCYIPLLNLIGKLSLRKAEKHFLREIGKFAEKLNSAEEFFTLVVNETKTIKSADSGE